MHTNRYDMYTGFHKLLRSRLYEASLRLGRADFERDGNDGDALTFVRETLSILVDHAAKEDAHVHRLLCAYGGELAALLDREHASLEDAISAIERMTTEIATLPPADRASLGSALYARFNAFVADQLHHMAREEREANAVLWAHLTDRELEEVHQAMLRSDPPERTAWLVEQLLPTLSLPERAAMWRRTSAHAPDAVVSMMRRIGERALGAEGWARVEHAARA
jgi:hypothetical protein